jgi:hypothetical protein
MSKLITFSFNEVQSIHEKAQALFPANNKPHDWSKSTSNLMDLMNLFSSLHLKKGLTLHAYTCNDGLGGSGVIWALPENSNIPDAEKCPEGKMPRFGFISPRYSPNRQYPKPPGSLDCFMDAIEGDGTPWAYLSASILARELTEFGAFWHGCDWSTHILIGANPLIQKPQTIDIGDAKEWKWKEQEPTNWLPHVSVGENIIQVNFYTLSQLGCEGIYVNNDIYFPGDYRPNCSGRLIASGSGGYIF